MKTDLLNRQCQCILWVINTNEWRMHMNNTALRAYISSNSLDTALTDIYGSAALQLQRARCLAAVDSFTQIFGEQEELLLLSAPGRTEIGGNHTDHNHGHVLAAAISLDVLAVVAPTSDSIVTFQSEGFPQDRVDLSVLSVQEEEKGRSAAIIRGIGARMKELGYQIGGFNAYSTSDVLKGSGLSSSAAFEVLVCSAFSHLFNEGGLHSSETAIISQYAENVYVGKPCGLMDQMACATGGFITVGFGNPQAPVVESIPFDFETTGYTLCIVDTKGDHGNLTPEYAAIPAEMKAVSAVLGQKALADCSKEEVYCNRNKIREKCGDRALLRAIHFFNDDARVLEQACALRNGDFARFLELVNESGRSSYMYLQNVFAPSQIQEQGISLGLCLTEQLLSGRGAFRVHGGGFAGTMQAYVPNDLLAQYKTAMEETFGAGSCYLLSVRRDGGIRIL